MTKSQYYGLMFWVLLIYTKVTVLSSNGSLTAKALIALGFILAFGYMVGGFIEHWKERRAEKAAKRAEQPEVHP